MIQKKDLHVHTVFSDGENTPEEIVLAAIDKGMDTVGFSDHSYTSFDLRYCMKRDDVERYKNEIARLKDKYRDKIEVLCGIEQDYYSDDFPVGFDYVIGSVHYLKCGEEYIEIDDDADDLLKIADIYFDGDMYAVCEKYFSVVSDVVSKTGADIVGHFDLISKFNEKHKLFDEENQRYRNAWQSAADNLLKSGATFEINTSGISKGYKKSPYPSPEICDYIRARGGKFIHSSDSHAANCICRGFDKAEY